MTTTAMLNDSTATSRVASKLSWLPMSSVDLTPLSALSICSINVDAGCDFHHERKQEEYLRAWANTAPEHCRRTVTATTVTPDDQLIHADRLGIEIDCNLMNVM